MIFVRSRAKEGTAENAGRVDRRVDSNQFRGWRSRIHGAQSTAKAAPDFSGVTDCQVQQQPFFDTAKLNMHVVGT